MKLTRSWDTIKFTYNERFTLRQVVLDGIISMLSMHVLNKFSYGTCTENFPPGSVIVIN